MGKGDRKTAKGKRTIGTYGNSRKKKRNVKPVIKPKKKAAAKKTSADKETAKKPVAKKAPAKKTTSKKAPASKKTADK
tara:strand:+ start:1887 stop:2120 length:234 start_codon:yes stop_codon:yes gene_type:complete